MTTLLGKLFSHAIRHRIRDLSSPKNDESLIRNAGKDTGTQSTVYTKIQHSQNE